MGIQAKTISQDLLLQKGEEQCWGFMYLISTLGESYDQASMADTTLKQPGASDLTSTRNKLLKLYRIQKGIHPRNPLDVDVEDNEQGG